MALMDWIRRITRRMLPKNSLEKKLDIQIATSGIMDNAIQLWLKMYENAPPWLGGKECVKSLNLPAAIAEELARLVLTEFDLKIEGSQRAEFLQKQFDHTIANISEITELWCALGGIVLKPYVSRVPEQEGDTAKIEIDVVKANRFYPTAFDSNKKITAAVFVDTKRIGDYMYTRLEHHKLEGQHYTIVNKAFRSERLNTITTEDDNFLPLVEHPFTEEVSLKQIEGWGSIQPVVEIDGIEKPFFVYIKTPRANNIDPHSPLGASCYSRAKDHIEQADKQFSRILWEYEAKEAAIDADETLFTTDKKGNPVLPAGKGRLFRTYDTGGLTQSKAFFEVFSPEIRDNSMFNGLNKLFRNIEFQCGLAYGTLSDAPSASSVDSKTAAEIKASKQRSYTTVSAMQTALERGINDTLFVMNALCDLYDLVPDGDVETTITWGDGVLEDAEAEYQRRWQMVVAGKMKLEKFYAWYFGCSEEQAMEYIPQQSEFPSEE